ncbi:asparagine synthetase B [Cohnella sp. REN36]|uniref:asparagine synthetase B family protein n=1 Tax=Cohnella sp. REN36 TaxID=2887347 RepID=UPI001D15888D|nr:asparagine synthetase B [Cohnella sp. REN36]MCC3376005.1 asparagine synthetase B [Cohnella sp. REN36]
MGAIAGIYLRDEEPVSAEERETLLREMTRYAADDTGIWQEGALLLTCRQQGITRESRAERLPFRDTVADLAIVADAILDNREELSDRLSIPREHREKMTDSELVLAAYGRWEREAPLHLVGDYAFVIWDGRRRQLFGARDPLGTRTLYITADPRRFAFCSAMAPLLGLPGVVRGIDEAWLSEFLAISDMRDAADPFSTVHASIRQLPPGHRFLVAEGFAVTYERFGSLVPTSKLQLRSDAEYVEAFREVFGAAVRSKIRTDREVGASLSGGLDSGAVVGYAAEALRQEGKVLHTYSCVPPADFVDWTGGGYVANERPFIAETIRHVGHLDEHYLDLEGRDPYSDLDELLDIREMPFKTFENSYWVNAMYARARQQGAGVLLTGAQGNHTISWGPAIDYYARLLKRFRWLTLHRELRLYGKRVRVRRSRLLPIVGKEAIASLLPRSFQAAEPFPAMIHPDFAAKTRVQERLKQAGIGQDEDLVEPWEERERHFGSAVIHNLIGTSGAKFSLRYGLWERDPTADARVIRFCLSLPIEQFVQRGMDRALVRRATERELPDAVRLNQRYRGVQGADWVHRMRAVWPVYLGELQEMCRDSLTAGILNIPLVTGALARIGRTPRPELALEDDTRLLMRCLIVYRFLKRAG